MYQKQIHVISLSEDIPIMGEMFIDNIIFYKYFMQKNLHLSSWFPEYFEKKYCGQRRARRETLYRVKQPLSM